MISIFEPYEKLTAGQQKFLCFLAYTGKKTDEKLQALYRHGEELTVEETKKLVNGLRNFYQSAYYNYKSEYQLNSYHIAPLMLYMLEEKPQWREHFDKFYKQHQAPHAMSLLSRLECCIKGKPLVARNSVSSFRDLEMLVPLASDDRFLPLMTGLIDIRSFVNNVVIYQTESDIADPLNIIGQIASQYYSSMMPAQVREMKATIALYDFFKTGRYDDDVIGHKDLFANILSGAQALYVGDYTEAFSRMTAAIRETNKTRMSQTKGFFYRLLNNYLLVLAYHFDKTDKGKKLAALIKKDAFMQHGEQKPATWLAEYLSTGKLPSQRTVSSYISGETIGSQNPLEKYLALLVARFLHIEVEWPKDLPAVPNMLFLRHELSPWLPLADEEKQQLSDDFGGEPLLSRIRYKQPWELLLE